MNFPENLLGRAVLVELGAAYAEATCPGTDRANLVRVAEAFTGYISKQITHDECRAALMDAIGFDDPLVKIDEILNLSDDPLPFHSEQDADDSALSIRRRTRTWTTAEDQRLLGGIVRFGLDNWQAVSRFLGSGRNRAQCSQRWSRGLNPRISKKGWTPEDDHRLEELVKQFGEKSWAKIASVLGNRSDVQCRYHYRQLVGGDAEDGMSLSKKGKSHSSSPDLFVDVVPPSPPLSPPPPCQPEETFMSLARGRTFASSPTMWNTLQNGERELLIPLSPLTDRRRVGRLDDSVLTVAPPRQRPTVVGADPQTLESFLQQFE